MGTMAETGKRYEIAMRRFREHLDAGLENWSTIFNTLQAYADGKDMPRETVSLAIQEAFSLLTTPVLRFSSGRYTPTTFWRKEPIAQLIARCNKRLFKDEDLVTQSEAASQIGVNKMRINRLVSSGALQTIPVFTRTKRSKPEIHRMILRSDLSAVRRLIDHGEQEDVGQSGKGEIFRHPLAARDEQRRIPVAV